MIALAGLDVTDRLVVCVGAGAVAERRIGRLRAAGARVRLIAPAATPALAALAAAGEIAWHARTFDPADLDEPPRASITNVSLVSWPDAALGFTFERVAMTTFVTGTVAGSLGTLFAQAGLRLARRGARILLAVARSQR